MNKEFTVEQVIEAVKAGGYPQGRFHLIEWVGNEEFEGEIKNADVIGMAALNLGIDPISLVNALEDVVLRKNSKNSLLFYLIECNDTQELTHDRIAANALVKFKTKLRDTITVSEQDYSKVTNYKGTIY